MATLMFSRISMRPDCWYENDGSQNFTHHIITSVADGAVQKCLRTWMVTATSTP